MRTTVRLDDNLLEQARREAQRRGETLTSLVEKGLRLELVHSQPSVKRRRVVLPVSKAGGGVMPGVDLNNSAALSDILDGVR
jgi:hypothetical protein